MLEAATLGVGGCSSHAPEYAAPCYPVYQQVSGVLSSTLDYLPTIAAAAGVRLPTDRSFDGIDLLPVLLGQHGAQGHSGLFHPNSADSQGEALEDAGVQGALDAVRPLQYKAVWQTGGVFGCGDGNRARPERFEPPLLFDLDADPQEATPLDPVTHAHVLVTVRRLRAAKEADINATFRSVTYILRHASPTCATLALPVPR